MAPEAPFAVPSFKIVASLDEVVALSQPVTEGRSPSRTTMSTHPAALAGRPQLTAAPHITHRFRPRSRSTRMRVKQSVTSVRNAGLPIRTVPGTLIRPPVRSSIHGGRVQHPSP